MRSRIPVVLMLLVFATAASAKDVYLAVSGKANLFFSDARIFNPSYDKDIVVTARYLPSGNVDNSGAASVPLTIPKRSVKVYDDAVQAIFGGGAPLGAIHLQSPDDFVATQRIYKDGRDQDRGTLGQFVQGLDLTTAQTKGILVQLKSGAASQGNFRTNWGGVNPNDSLANISFTLFDKSGAVAGTNDLTLQPFGVFAPTDIVEFFGSPSSDLSDAWITFESDKPVFLYGSVIDQVSEDPTYVAAVEDTGDDSPPQQKTATVTAVNWAFTFNASAPLVAGDEVRFLVQATEGIHGFRLFSPGGSILIDLATVNLTEAEQVVTLTTPGTYSYVCTRTLCGAGHSDMNGSFVVGSAVKAGGDH